MKITKQFAIAGAFAAALLFSGSGFAADGGKDVVLKDDAKCTSCHDEAAANPGVLTIGQTKHGAHGDARTPTCTSCHGDSADHTNYKGTGKPPKPERYFSKKGSPVEVKNEACLSCHRGGSHMNWKGSAHEANDVACSSCHSVHVPVSEVLPARANTCRAHISTR